MAPAKASHSPGCGRGHGQSSVMRKSSGPHLDHRLPAWPQSTFSHACTHQRLGQEEVSPAGRVASSVCLGRRETSLGTLGVQSSGIRPCSFSPVGQVLSLEVYFLCAGAWLCSNSDIKCPLFSLATRAQDSDQQTQKLRAGPERSSCHCHWSYPKPGRNRSIKTQKISALDSQKP